jgi:hypothetical protein
MGCCFTFDARACYGPDAAPVAVKAPHSKSGDDWRVERIRLDRGQPLPPLFSRRWRGWAPFSPPRARARRSGPGKARHAAYRLFWGDLHCHSDFSPDAEGEPDELYHFARDGAGLDFVCVADNDYYPYKTLLDAEVHLTGELARAFSRDEEFVAFSGYEWTFHRRDASRSFNHRIVVLPEGGGEIARRNEPEGRSERAFKDYLAQTGYFNFPHHAHWKLLRARGEHAVEVTAAWGTYILDAPTVFDALNRGHAFAFLGNSDSHRFLPGLSGALTGVYAEGLTRRALLDAIRAGRTFATTGNRTALAFWVNDAFLGSETSCSGRPLIRWRVQPWRALERVMVIRDGRRAHQSSKKTGQWVDEEVSPGRHWYMLQAEERGAYRRHPHNVAAAFGKYAWSTPIRVLVG